VVQNNANLTQDGAPFRLGPWRVDPAACELHDGETVVRLRPKVMDLLAVFARNPGEVLSKHCLLDLVWSDVTVGDASLTVAVGELRDALGDHLDKPEFIETIPRRGYRLIAPVTNHEAHSQKPEGSRFWLTGAGFELVLRQGLNLIGRAPDAEIRIESPKVSRRHARITVNGDTAVVEDLGSKNGTFVGDSRIEGTTPLAHGDQLRLGQLAAVLSIMVADHGSTITELSRELEAEPSADS
jgi:DNA-binding winged helix-turn-helix (wHTH) protein